MRLSASAAVRGRPNPHLLPRACKKAAYEARRSKLEGAVVVQVVERIVVQEHGINECVHRVQASPVAVRHVLNEAVR